MAWTGACPDAWPMRTERSARSVGIGTNALASSIVLVCRLRPESATPATRREFIATLRRELPDALKNRRRAVTYRPRCQPHRGRDRAAPSGPARSARRGDAGHRGTHAGGGAGPRGEAIYQSLRRRRERLERWLREEEIARRGLEATAKLHTIREQDVPYLTAEDIEDLDDAPESEVERLEEEIADKATAARTIDELRKEIEALKGLEALALRVRQSGTDRKWEELSRLLQGNAEMFDPQGQRRKLIIFTEHRDTLRYLKDRITTLLGRLEAVVVIHGGMGREARRTAQEEFIQDPDVRILVATDAAGEGVSLQ